MFNLYIDRSVSGGSCCIMLPKVFEFRIAIQIAIAQGRDSELRLYNTLYVSKVLLNVSTFHFISAH